MILDGAGNPFFCVSAVFNKEPLIVTSPTLRRLDAAGLEVYRRLIDRTKKENPELSDMKSIISLINRNEVKDLFITTITATKIIQEDDAGRIELYAPNTDCFIFIDMLNKTMHNIQEHVHPKSGYFEIAYYVNEAMLENIPKRTLPENMKFIWEEILCDDPPRRRKRQRRQ